MKLGKYFYLEEFTVSQTAVRRGMLNTPSPEAVAALGKLVEHILDPLREILGSPIVVTSGYRSKMVNIVVGGSHDSQHCLGEAADCIFPGRTITEVFEMVRKSNLPFDQAISEGGAWLHLSYGERKRREALNAQFTTKGMIYRRIK